MVSVKEQAALVVDRLRRSKTLTFRALARDSPDILTTVARFLSLLELFREGAVSFDQVSPLGELTVRWTGAEEGEVEIHDEFDGAPPEVADVEVSLVAPDETLDETDATTSETPEPPDEDEQ
jgi:segregation and condensation protein A